MSRATRLAKVVAVVALLGVTTAYARYRSATHRSQMQHLASSDEIDSAFAFDSRSGLLAYANDSGKGGLFVVDTRNGNAVSSVKTEVPWPKQPVISPGGRWVAYHDLDPYKDERERTLYVADRQTGASLLVPRATGDSKISRAAFSPDGHTLLYESDGALRTFDTATATDRLLFRDPASHPARGPAWSPDGARVYFFLNGALVRLTVDGATLEHLAALPNDATLFPNDSPESPAISIDERFAAFTVVRGGCVHVGFVRIEEKRFHLLDADECSLRPTFVGQSSSTVAYVAYPRDGNRVPRVRSLIGGASQSLEIDEGMTYRIASDGNTAIALLATPTRPRAFVRLPIDPLGHPSTILDGAAFPGDPPARSYSTTTASFDGTKVPVRVFLPTCRRAGSAGPAVLYAHGSPLGSDDVAPALTREIEYLTRAGIAVVAVNYRGSTGYGESYNSLRDASDQARDLAAGLSVIDKIPEIDRASVYALGICYASYRLLPRLVTGTPSAFRGVISWAGPNMPWSTVASKQEGYPDVLWLVSDRDASVESSVPAADSLSMTGALTVVRLGDNHMVMRGESRERALDAVRRFIGARSSDLCSSVD